MIQTDSVPIQGPCMLEFETLQRDSDTRICLRPFIPNSPRSMYFAGQTT